MITTMWAQYRKTLIPTQLLVVAVCLGAYYLGGMPPAAVAVIFIVMQVGAIIGTWWGLRIKRQLRDADERLPLDRR